MSTPKSPATLPFTAVIYAAQAGGFWGEVPVIPACATQGQSSEEVAAKLTQIAEAYLSTHLPPQDNVVLRPLTVPSRDRTHMLTAVVWETTHGFCATAVPLHDRVARGTTPAAALATLSRLLPGWIAEDAGEGESVPVHIEAHTVTIHPRLGVDHARPPLESGLLAPEVLLVFLRAAGLTKEQFSELLDYEPE